MARGKSLEEKRAEIDRKIEQRNLTTALRAALDAAKAHARDKQWDALERVTVAISACAARLCELEGGSVADADETGEQPER